MKSYLGMIHKMNQYSTFYSTYKDTHTPTHQRAGIFYSISSRNYVAVFSTTVNMGCFHFRENISNVIVFSLRPNLADITHHGNAVFILDIILAVPLNLLGAQWIEDT